MSEGAYQSHTPPPVGSTPSSLPHSSSTNPANPVAKLPSEVAGSMDTHGDRANSGSALSSLNHSALASPGAHLNNSTANGVSAHLYAPGTHGLLGGGGMDSLPFASHFPGTFGGQHGGSMQWSSFPGGVTAEGLTQMGAFAYPQQHMMATPGGGGANLSGLWQADPFAFGGAGGQKIGSLGSTALAANAHTTQSERGCNAPTTEVTRLEGGERGRHLSESSTVDDLVTERVNSEIKGMHAEIQGLVDAGVKAGMDTHLKEMVDAELARILQGNKKGPGGDMPPAILRAVHTDMRFLMGIRDKSGRPGRKKAWVLPDPLGPEEEARRAGDGSPLHNPDWYKDANAGVNNNFICDTVKLVKQKADDHQLDPLLVQDDELIRRAAVGYFKSMKRKYIGEHNPEAGEKLKKRGDIGRYYQRRHRKTHLMRIGIEPFRIVFGLAETEGVQEIVCSSCVSEEGSADEALAETGVRDARRREADVGAGAFEVHPLMWRAVEVSRLYMVLTVFSRYVREKEDIVDLENALAALATEAAEVNMPEDVRLAKSALLRGGYLDKVKEAVKGWSTIYFNKSQRHERFRGPRSAYIHSAPDLQGSKIPYTECISAKWAAKSSENSRVAAKLPGRPSTCTIFDLVLPDSLIPADDLAWLTTVEDEGYEAGGEDEADPEV
ncbi:hypothetical protein C2E23DRAFT_883022 [Lenzites betulinus]|nr:hypothetical protein C2E23DRAFT_883022 [Lenzites betulinus]